MNDSEVILVTGGASGIGLAIVRALLDASRRVVVADASAERLESAHDDLVPWLDRVRFQAFDVTDENAVESALDRCEREFGPVVGAVNSAGIGIDAFCLDTSAAQFRKIVDVNLVGSFLVAREAAKRMRPRGRGAIVNIASVSGLRGNPGRVAYGASKAGVLLMTQVMAVELAPLGIRVNAIAPGPIETPLVAAMHTDDVRAAWRKAVPQGRYGDPEEVAAAAVFLLDEAKSSFITGQTLCIDGGFTASGFPRDRV